MKKWVAFLLGLILGVVLAASAMFALGYAEVDKSDDGMIFYEESGDVVQATQIEVFQALDDNRALAYAQYYKEEKGWFTGNSYNKLDSSLLTLIINDEGVLYYDGQIIEIPEGKCVRQVGVYRYLNKDGDQKTVPIVKILDE